MIRKGLRPSLRVIALGVALFTPTACGGLTHQGQSSGEERAGSTSDGRVACFNGASATLRASARSTASGRSTTSEHRVLVAADVDMPARGPRSDCEAESATLTGCRTFPFKRASGGAIVLGLGQHPGDAVTFERIPEGQGLAVFYASAPPGARRCSLYAAGVDVATVPFEDTGSYLPPCGRVRVDARVRGPLSLRVDADDFEANGGKAIGIDKVVVAPPRVDLAIEGPGWRLKPGMNLIRFACQGPASLVYHLSLKDDSSSPTLYVGPDVRMGGDLYLRSDPIVGPAPEAASASLSVRPDKWCNVAIPLYDFTPPIDPSDVRGRVGRLRFHLVDDNSVSTQGVRGVVSFGDARFDRASGVWPSTPLPGCPFENSRAVTGVAFTGRHREYEHADTWYPAWAPDGNLYSPYTDGTVAGVPSLSATPAAVTGMARIAGDDPLRLKVESLGVYKGAPAPYNGRYPCASLFHNGIWYFGTYGLGMQGDTLNGTLGPLVGLRYSRDYGKTWTDTPCTPADPLFGETASLRRQPVKMGTPHFVDFGRDMEHSPDGKAYLLGHGAATTPSLINWMRGDAIFLARVIPSPETINDVSQYEFLAGYDTTRNPPAPIWDHRFSAIKPLLEWKGRLGCVTATYIAPLRKYLMCVTHGDNPFTTFDTLILEADAMTGPWRLVTYMSKFGEEAYFVNIPSKFISADGRTMWLCYSANWANIVGSHTDWKPIPPGGKYALCLQEMRLLGAKD